MFLEFFGGVKRGCSVFLGRSIKFCRLHWAVEVSYGDRS